MTPLATPLASGPEFSDEDFNSSNNNADTDKEDNLVSIDHTNAVSIPSDDPIGVSEILSKGDVTLADTQSNDATDGATATAATNTATVEDGTIAKIVVSTVSSTETVAAAIADGGAVSASDSTAEDVVGSGAKDVADSTAALKPTTADATGAVSESTVAANDIAVNEPTAPTISTTATTAVGLTPIENSIIAITEDVGVANAVAAMQDTVLSAEINASNESPSVVPVENVSVTVTAEKSSTISVESPSTVPVESPSTVSAELPFVAPVETASSTLAVCVITASVTEETLAHSSATNETPSAEEHTARQKDKAGLTDKEVQEELEPAKKKNLKKEKEPVRNEEPVKKEKKSEKKEQEPVRKEEPAKKEKKNVTKESIGTPTNRCSYVDTKEGRRCPSRVLTLPVRGDTYCQSHSNGSHGDFVYSNKHISILLVKDFKGNK